MAKTVKAKNLTPVKTKNPLINGSFDEAAAREVLRMVKENDIKIIDLKFNPRMVNSPRLAAVPLENLVSIPRSLLRGSLFYNLFLVLF